MKFLNFFILYGKRTVRDKMFFLIMLLFPFLLIWMLGSAFSGIMGGGDEVSEPSIHASIIYTITEESRISGLFEEYMTEDNEYFSLARFDDLEEGKNKIKYHEYDAYVTVGTDKITVYKNSYYNFNAAMGELIIKAFTDEYNLMYEIAVTDPTAMDRAGDVIGSGFTEEVSFDRERTPGAMDYYGVSMSTMFIFYGMIFLGTYFSGNRLNKTEGRIKSSPANILSYQWGTALGNVVLMMIQALLLIIAGMIVFKVYWGNALGISLLVILAETLMVSAIGTVLGLTMKNEGAIAGIAQILIPAIVFLGDGYVEIGGGATVQAIKKLSPMYWINHGIFDAIYLNEHRTAFISITISLGVALVCTAVIVLLNVKRNRRTANA